MAPKPDFGDFPCGAGNPGWMSGDISLHQGGDLSTSVKYRLRLNVIRIDAIFGLN